MGQLARNTINSLIISILWVMLLSGCAKPSLDQHAIRHHNSPSQPSYHIALSLNEQKDWLLARSLIDPHGYTQYYIPKDQAHELPHNIIVHYGRNVTTGLMRTMQQVSSGNKHAECKSTSTQPLLHSKKSLVFINTLKDCFNNKSLWQIYKVFNRRDGQYAIIYTAELNQVPKKTRLHMQDVIKLAQLVKYNK